MMSLRVVTGAACLALALLIVPARAQEAQPLDPDTPMAAMPDLGVDWPALDAADATAESGTTEATGEQRYDVKVTGIDGLPADIAARFATLSVLKEGEGKPANAAQLDRRARDDAELLTALLRADGYYDATVDTGVERAGERLSVTLTVTPGEIYKFTDVTVANPADGAVAAFGVKTADAVDADAVVAGQAAVQTRLKREGYPFATVGEPDVTIDHDTHEATLTLPVQPGEAKTFGGIVVTGERPPFDAGHVGVIARFKSGRPYNQDLVDDLRRALIATGLVAVAEVKPVEGKAPGTVDIQAKIDRAPPRTIAGEAGFGTGEGYRIEVSWQHRNLLRPEGGVTLRGIAGTREQLAGAVLRMNNFRKRDQVLNARLLASHVVRDAYDARSIELGASIERQTNIIWQKKWTWSVGPELIASDERDFVIRAGVRQRRTYLIGAIPGTLAYDGTDDLLDPKHGYRLAGRLSPELSLQGGAFGYARAQVDASYYWPATPRVVIAGRARVGATVGAAREDIAPSRRFYAGGGGSVRGYGYQSIGPRNVLNDPIGGRSLAEFSLEARVRIDAFGGNFGVVPFIDAGNIYTGTFPRFTGLRLGTGLGLRYYTSFGPIRIDVGTPLNRRSGDPRVAVYVSLGQAF